MGSRPCTQRPSDQNQCPPITASGSGDGESRRNNWDDPLLHGALYLSTSTLGPHSGHSDLLSLRLRIRRPRYILALSAPSHTVHVEQGSLVKAGPRSFSLSLSLPVAFFLPGLHPGLFSRHSPLLRLRRLRSLAEERAGENQAAFQVGLIFSPLSRFVISP